MISELRRVRALARADVELFNAYIAIAFGISLLTPLVESTAPSLSFMVNFAPIDFWALLFITLGLIQIRVVLTRMYIARMLCAMVGVFLWLFATIGALSFRGPAFVLYGAATLAMAWAVLVGIRR